VTEMKVDATVENAEAVRSLSCKEFPKGTIAQVPSAAVPIVWTMGFGREVSSGVTLYQNESPRR